MSDSTTETPILLTGFPGFLSEYLVDQLAQTTDARLHFLCLRAAADSARGRLKIMEATRPQLEGRWTIHRGDIAEEKLGLGDEEYEELQQSIGVVWHLAAIYDLAVAEEIAYAVNVGGTYNVLDFCEGCPNFERLNYVSTCFVAGERTGTIFEEELDVGQHHHNHYEATKFWAEVEVQRRRDDLPTTIFRPSIVIGDSHTGRTNKYDGPYYVFQLLNRLPEWMPVPSVGRGDTTVNLVPVDFVAEAMARLGHHRDSLGAVYHLADPHPMKARHIVDRVLEKMGRRHTMGRLPARWVERALANQSVEQWAGLPQQALTYFQQPTTFDTENASEALSNLDLQCPPLAAYLDRIVDFFLKYPDGPPSSPEGPKVQFDQSSSEKFGTAGGSSGGRF